MASHHQLEQAGGIDRPSAEGAYIEVDGELRYREYTPTESDRSVYVAEVHASSILALDRSDRQPVSTLDAGPGGEVVD